MAPTPISITDIDIPDLHFSSLELDQRSTPISRRSSPSGELSTRTIPYNPFLPRSDEPILSPIDQFNFLTARQEPRPTTNPGAGSIDPTAFNMKGIQALFAIIGASFVLASIWFFFWAKNGGFQFRKGDWDEYKSTVLRRKGPNGTTLSNATKSTNLGGGSVVGAGYSDKDAASFTDGTHTETMTVTDMSSEAPLAKSNSRRKNKKESAKERRLREAEEAAWEGGNDEDMRAYRHERPARVGGINRESEALHYGTDYSETTPSATASEVHSNAHAGPRVSGPRQPSRQSSPDKRQSRRDFSYAAGTEDSFSVSNPPPAAAAAAAAAPRPARYHSPSKDAANQRPIRPVPGSFHEPADWDVQSQYTKSYHHPIPGLAPGKNAGYRRDRRDSLED